MKDKYLRETRMVDFSNPAIQKLIQNMKWKEMGEFERIKAIYNYVRDDVLFGYNIDDGISASKVLADGYGQCNTKGTLFMALLRACNIPCRVHGFTIDKGSGGSKGCPGKAQGIKGGSLLQSVHRFR